MESNGEPTLHPSSDEARASLEDVRRMEADLADLLVTPWWYYPGLGLVEALFITSMTFPAWLGLPAVALGLGGLGLLVRNYQRLTGLGLSLQYSALAPGWVIALVGTYLSAIVVVLLADHPVVTALVAMVVFAATVPLGRGADTAIRKRLRDGRRTR